MKSGALLFISVILFACTKQVGKNPELAYSDLSLLDTALASYHKYYKDDPAAVLNAAGNSPHGSFKLRVNSIASKAMNDNGKLPVNGIFPDGSFLVKDILLNGELEIYAYMYKRNGSWLWGEVNKNRTFLYTQKNAAICTSCHQQPGNRDLVVTFNYH